MSIPKALAAEAIEGEHVSAIYLTAGTKYSVSLHSLCTHQHVGLRVQNAVSRATTCRNRVSDTCRVPQEVTLSSRDLATLCVIGGKASTRRGQSYNLCTDIEIQKFKIYPLY